MLGLLAWILLAALGVVLSVEINVVRVKQLYPRALLTPFTDNVDLTHADHGPTPTPRWPSATRASSPSTSPSTTGARTPSARKRADDELDASGRDIVRDYDA